MSKINLKDIKYIAKEYAYLVIILLSILLLFVVRGYLLSLNEVNSDIHLDSDAETSIGVITLSDKEYTKIHDEVLDYLFTIEESLGVKYYRSRETSSTTITYELIFPENRHNILILEDIVDNLTKIWKDNGHPEVEVTLWLVDYWNPEERVIRIYPDEEGSIIFSTNYNNVRNK